MLYIVATPIGNLADFTFRALQTLQEVDYILCEDTRRTRILINHYKIDKPLKSYHKFNEAKKEEEILDDLRAGKKIALVSDAGTPCISDPGSRLVAACHAAQIPVNPIPGPSSVVATFSASGFDDAYFQFVGFLPKKKKELKELLSSFLIYHGATICFESPYRVRETLKLLATIAPTRLLFIGREITKKFETHYRGTAPELALLWKEKPPKGEIVLIISSQNL